VEKGKGGPSKLVSHTTTYTLTRAEKLNPEERLTTGQYLLEVAALQDNSKAKAIADELYRIQGVERIGVDLAQRTLAIHTSTGTVISPWTLVSAAERAQHRPVTVKGPFGTLAIKRPTAATTTSTARLPQTPPQK
jgi:hypothetical protein